MSREKEDALIAKVAAHEHEIWRESKERRSDRTGEPEKILDFPATMALEQAAGRARLRRAQGIDATAPAPKAVAPDPNSILTAPLRDACKNVVLWPAGSTHRITYCAAPWPKVQRLF